MTTQYISAIDIGTNSFHLLVAKNSGETFEVIQREREVLRLLDDCVSDTHIISDDKIEQAIEILSKFKMISDGYSAQINAVATSAMRDSINKEEVCSKIYEAVGIKIKVLAGEEEATLVFKAATFRKEISPKKVLIFDLGGGSTEFIIGRAGKIIYKSSIQLGAVRFTQKHFPEYILTTDRIEKFREEVKSILVQTRKNVMHVGFDNCIGIGGTITSTSWLIEKNIYGIDHNFVPLNSYKIMKKDFAWVRELVLNKKTFEERKTIQGMEIKRADIIAAGILIVDELFRTFLLDEIIASSYSIKEGIVINAMQKFSL
jgi:exopolyphosphatase / guanosine-5'-triphosphate,3'-diphosphate pyrophosphatase